MTRVFVVVLVVGLASVSSSVATPVQWRAVDGGNDHWYEAILRPEGLPRISWEQANNLAEDSGGVWHLATVHSAAENDFIFALVDDPAFWIVSGNVYLGPFLGAKSPTNESNDFQWVTGEPWTYENWLDPATYPQGDGQYLHFSNMPFDPGQHVPGDRWNDLLASFTLNGYVVESSAVSPAPLSPSWIVPEPGTGLLLLLGLTGLAACGRQRRS